jgi:hypothetical protein
MNLDNYSLALIKDNKIVFSSEKPGLRPLLECVIECKDKYSSCTLHDKVTGLAAARLVVYSGMVSNIKTKTASKLAADFLKQNKIELSAQTTVNNILNKDRTSVCPMELRASDAKDNAQFFAELKKIILRE